MPEKKKSLISKLFYFLTGNSKELPLQHRLFNITVFSTALFVIAGTIINFALQLNVYIQIFTVVVFLILSVIYFISFKYRVFKPLLLVYFSIVLATVIALWFINGGSNGPTAFSFLLIIYVFNLIYDGKQKVLLNLIIISVLASLFIVEYICPESVVGYKTDSDRFFDVFYTKLAYILIMAFTSLFYFRSFYNDKKLTEIQRDEISDINIEIKKTQAELYKHKENLEELVKKRTKELIHSNKQLEKARDKAENSDKLKTAFLSNMSHEIRTPMNVIIGLSQLIKRRELDKVKHDEYIDTIINKGNLLLNIINDILDVSKIEANELNINMSECDLSKLLHDIYLTFDGRLNANVKLKLDISEELVGVVINTDSLRLKQVLINLVENARKFTNDGEILIGCKLNEDSNYLEFFVKDTGIGIPQDMQSVIFNRFRQIEESSTKEFRGAGLGLTISKKIIELLSGTIWLKSTIGVGSVFYFKIPYLQYKSNVIEVENVLISNNWSGKTLLLAEDEDFNFIVLRDLLEETNVNLIRATNGKEVLEILDKTKVDIVLLDIQMPIMNGFEVCEVMKRKYNDIPVIAQTAYVMVEDEKRLIELGCNGIINKPIDFDELLELVGTYLN